jgi:hypothetical protein
VGVTYVDVITAPVGGAEYVAELTWINEQDDYALRVHHYFVDYPGAKSLERALTEVVGGSPMVRYSCNTVLKTFLNDVPDGNVVAFRTRKEKSLIRSLLLAGNNEINKAFCTFEDTIPDDEEYAKISDIFREARAEASRKFGNAL